MHWERRRWEKPELRAAGAPTSNEASVCGWLGAVRGACQRGQHDPVCYKNKNIDGTTGAEQLQAEQVRLVKHSRHEVGGLPTPGMGYLTRA